MLPNDSSTAASDLQAARLTLGWTQLRTIYALEEEATKQGIPIAGRKSLKAMLSTWENGHGRPGPVYRQLFTRIYALTEYDLGFQTVIQPVRVSAVPPAVGPEMVDYFRNVFVQHLHADNLMGPHHLVEVVQAQAGLLEQLLPSARGSIRDQLTYLACKYNEFTGWLHQDAGSPEIAMKWSDRAMDFALEIGDPVKRSYVLMRKCNIAIDQHSPSRAIGLSEAALNDLKKLPPRIRALILVQAARAHAASGNSHECSNLLDQAHHEVTRNGVDSDQLATYCNEAYILMEAAACWQLLGQDNQAAPIFQESLSHWPSNQRRDQGLCLARLASSLAAQGNQDEACNIGMQAIDVVKTATSVRSLLELERLRSKMLPWKRDSNVLEFNRYLSQSLTQQRKS